MTPAEWMFAGYFTYAAAAALVLRDAPWRVASTAVVIVCLIVAVSRTHSGPFHRLRDWLPLPLVILAYWHMDGTTIGSSPDDFARRWIGWDDVVLVRWGVSAAIERWSWLPLLLEVVYAATYAMPVIAVGLLYALRRRDRLDRFYVVFLGGTLVSYALLPLFPSVSPRLSFPDHMLPPMFGARRVNVWLLDHADIRSSVFPSGHVTAALSAAFGMLVALPERPWIGGLLGLFASAIWLATVYGRYHYVVDGMASVGISLLAWRIANLSLARRAARPR